MAFSSSTETAISTVFIADQSTDDQFPLTLQVEAETMTLTNYVVESYDFDPKKKGKETKIISLLDRPKSKRYESGTASTTFDGPSGYYKIVIAYHDETDGQGTLSVKQNGTVLQSAVLDQDLDKDLPTLKNKIEKEIVSQQFLQKGDTITIEGTSDFEPKPKLPLYGEYTRVDYIQFIQVESPPPDAVDDLATTDEDQPVIINVLANDINGGINNSLILDQINGIAATVNQPILLPSGATVSRNQDDTLVYHPYEIFDGLLEGEQATDSFTYQINNGSGGSDTATVTIAIAGINDEPTANPDGGIIQEDASPNSISGNVLLNDTDIDTPQNSLSVVGIVSNGLLVQPGQNINGIYGSFTINSDGSYSYVLDNNNGIVSALQVGQMLEEPGIIYRMTDGVATDEAILTIQIEGTNDGPVATDDFLPAIQEGVPIKINFSTLMSNDSDSDSSNLEITSINTDNSAAGALEVDYVNKMITFTPAFPFISRDINGNPIQNSPDYSFTYMLSDGQTTDLAQAFIPVRDSEFQFLESEFNNCFTLEDCQRLEAIGATGIQSGAANVIPRSNFGVFPDPNVVDDTKLRIRIQGALGRAEDRAEVDLLAVHINAGETVVLDVDYGSKLDITGVDIDEQLNTQLLVFEPSIVEALLNPAIETKPDPIHQEFDTPGLLPDSGSANNNDPFLQFTATTTGTHYFAIATEDTVWRRNAGRSGDFTWGAGQFVKTVDNEFAGDYILNMTILNPSPIMV